MLKINNFVDFLSEMGLIEIWHILVLESELAALKRD